MANSASSALYSRSLMPPALEIGRLHILALQELGAGPGQRDLAVDHDVAAMRELEGVEGVLLDQEDRDLVARVELAHDVEDLLGDQWGEAERGLVEQQEARAAHQGAGDRQHLLLAARQRAAALVAPLGETGEH